MHGRSRIAVAELSLQKEIHNQSLLDYGIEERVALRRYCLFPSSAGALQKAAAE